MHETRSFLAMGGYALYVWPAYGITIAAFALMLIWTLRGRTARRREEKQLAAMGRRGRARRGEQA
jgi:heme exporter protein D